MNENRYDKPNETEIDLKELFLCLFQRWCVLLLCMVLCAALLVAWQASKNGRSAEGKGGVVNITPIKAADDYSFEGTYKTELTLYKYTIENYGRAITTDAETESEESAEGYMHLIESLCKDNEADRQQLQESILMNLPETGASKVAVDLLIQTEDAGTINRELVLLYRNMLGSQSTYTELAQRWNTTPDYITELISFDDSVSRSNSVIVESSDASWLSISCLQVDAEKANELMDYALEQVERMCPVYASETIPHTVTVMNRTEGIQRTRASIQTREQLEAKVAIFDALTERYETYRAMAERTYADKAAGSKIGLSAKKAIKWGIVGLAGGLVLGMLLLLLIRALSGTVYLRDEVDQMYGLRSLMVFPRRKNGKELSGITRWLESKKESRRTRALTREQRFDIAAVNLQAAAGEGEIIALAGAATHEALQELADELQRRLPEKKIQPLFNPAINAAETKQLASCDKVVLVTELNARRREVEDVAHVIGNFQVPVIGTMTM